MIILFNAIIGVLSFFGIVFVSWIIYSAINIKKLNALREEREAEADDIINTIEAIKRAVGNGEKQVRTKRSYKKRAIKSRKGSLINPQASESVAKKAFFLMEKNGVAKLSRKSGISRFKLHRIKRSLKEGTEIPRLRAKEALGIDKEYNKIPLGF